MQHTSLAGYWFPYEAARAMAARFCWRIRFALTIVFGKDFPGDCLDPEKDKDEFGRYNIDPAIIAACTERVRRLKQAEATRSQKQQDSKASAQANFAPPRSRYTTPPEGTHTPPCSAYPTASPELLGSMSREQAHSGTYFDPVRDSSRPSPFGSNNHHRHHHHTTLPSLSDWANFTPPSPAGNSPLSQYRPFEQQHLQQQYLQQPPPEGAVCRQHLSYPYHYAAGHGAPTPTHSVGGDGGLGYGSSPHRHVWRSSPTEALMTPSVSATPYYTPRQSHQHPSANTGAADPAYAFDTPLYPPIMPPADPVPQYAQPFSPALAPELPQVIPQRRESTAPHLDSGHPAKRRRVLDQAAEDPEAFKHEDDYRARMFTRPTVPDPSVEVDAEGDIAEAAAGLMSLNQQDLELERENSRRRNSA